MQTPVLVLDNGGSTIKAGLSTDSAPTLTMPNTTARIKKSLHELIGDETITSVQDHSQLLYYRPIEKGYLVNWDIQSKIWHRLFSEDQFNINPQENCLYLSQPVLNMDDLMKGTMEVVFEHFQFASFRSCTSPHWAFVKHMSHLPATDLSKHSQTGLIIESGFSFTHVIPIVSGQIVSNAIQRISVGGKLLTNLLKESISFRQVNVQDCTYLVNRIKEQYSYLSLDVFRDLSLCKKSPSSNRSIYVLPDYITSSTGYELKAGQKVDPNQQVISLTNERFMVPEALFHPSDIGIHQSGIAECVGNCLNLFAPGIRDLLINNILLTGGNCQISGFESRVTNLDHLTDTQDIVPFIEEGKQYHIYKAEDPINDTWKGGCLLAQQPGFEQSIITREVYEENGPLLLLERAFQSTFILCSIKQITQTQEVYNPLSFFIPIVA